MRCSRVVIVTRRTAELVFPDILDYVEQSRRKSMSRKYFISFVAVICICFGTHAAAQEPHPIPPEQFEKLHAMFKTQPGESRFWELPWMTQLDEALKKGAVEGKPIFVWCGAGGAPVGVC
jgi:hypothetical protein